MEDASLPSEIRDILTLDQFMNQKMKRGRRNDYKSAAPRDYQQALRRVTLAHFDGSAKSTARAWVQKLDNYLSLRPMPEEDAIKFATLHLDIVAHEWWYHGLVTLGHNLITTYADFTNKLIERFDTRDLEVKFRELAQLRQQGSLDTYVTEFQNLSVMVSSILEKLLVVLFTEGLEEPLRGWVKAFDPPTLAEAI